MASKLLSAGLFASLASFASANCAYGTSLFPRLPNVPVSTFGYDALKGPLNWYGLNETANVLCAEGSTQSPIVLNSSNTVVPGSSVEWKVDAYPHGTTFENLGTNVEVVVNGSLVDKHNGRNYSLAQFHFHTPAEHRIDDEFYSMEMHWVFETEAKQYAVVAFLVDLCEQKGCGEPVFDQLFKSITEIRTPGQAVKTGPLHLSSFIKDFHKGSAYRYSGSLTTPPCSQQVDWLVSTKPLKIDLPTWLTVKSVIKFNARYTQDWLGDVNLLKNAAEELPQ